MKTTIPRCPFCKTMMVGHWVNVHIVSANAMSQQLSWYCPMPVGLEHDRYQEPEWVLIDTVEA